MGAFGRSQPIANIYGMKDDGWGMTPLFAAGRSSRSLVIPGWLMLIAGGAGCGLPTILLSNDWACDAIGMAILGGLLAVVINGLAGFALARWTRNNLARSHHHRLNYKWQVALLLLLTAGAAVQARCEIAGNNVAFFEMAFGMPPPHGISHLSAAAYYNGGPGDSVCLMTFYADDRTIDMLTRCRHMTAGAGSGLAEPFQIRLYKRGKISWAELWYDFAYMAIPKNPTSWRRVPIVRNPAIYGWFKDTGKDPIQALSLMWDPATGKAYAIYTSG